MIQGRQRSKAPYQSMEVLLCCSQEVQIMPFILLLDLIYRHLSEAQTATFIDALEGLQLDDLILICADSSSEVADDFLHQATYSLRRELLALNMLKPLQANNFKFLWVVDFPLIEAEEAEGKDGGKAVKLQSAHHPFTAPQPDDVDLLKSKPLEVRGQHYDLVSNLLDVCVGICC